ncbi:MAG: hypothetical protein OEY59_05485 [Deltaproteobacteria bacterium]|nr:hypothetical protein [Deltaproteobacteria bacterium]
MALKIIVAYFIIPSQFDVISKARISIDLKDSSFEYMPQRAEVNQILTDLIGQSDQFFINRLSLIPQNLLDRFLTQQRTEQDRKPIARRGGRYDANSLVSNAIVLQMQIPFEPMIIYRGQDEKLGRDLVVFFTSELANYIKLKAVQSSFLLENKISGLELSLNRQDKNLAIPELSQNRKRFYEQRKEESQVKLHRLKNQDSVNKRISSSTQVIPVEVESKRLFTADFIGIWDLYLFILLSFIFAAISLLMEFSKQGFTSETQMIRYLKVDLIGSIPKIENPYQQGD